MYNGRHFIREQKYICGEYMEVSVYPVFQPKGKRRSKCNPATTVQAKLNERNAQKKLTRLIHTNFTPDDIALHLTYDNAPDDIKQAGRDLYNFILRLKRAYKKQGFELRYITTTEQGQKTGRIHHHLLINAGISRDAIERLWNKGYANSKRLQFSEDGVGALSQYMTKARVGYRSFNRSKNLITPVPIITDGEHLVHEVQRAVREIQKQTAHAYFEDRYDGYVLTRAYFSVNEINHFEYLGVLMRRKG